MTDEETLRFIGYLVDKHRWLGKRSPKGPNLEAVVATTVADTLLVCEGALSIEDFRPDRSGQ